MKDPILKVENLTTRFYNIDRTVTAVESLSLSLFPDEILGIVGESGSGKSVTNLSIMGLIEEPGKIDENSRILLKTGTEYTDLSKLSEKEMQKIRGNKISMIFQEPSASFNPLFKLGGQIGESLRLHSRMDKKKAYAEAIELMHQVHIPNFEYRAQDYPFQMSGGMLQRMMIAQALACKPEILIADEPTTALDVTTQAQILGLIKEKQRQSSMSVIFVTHDLALLEDFCDRIVILYAGTLMEEGIAAEVIANPIHPYTRDLLKAIPRPGMFKEDGALFTIPGKVPTPGEVMRGCPYAERCSRSTAECFAKKPGLCALGDRKVRCHNAQS